MAKLTKSFIDRVQPPVGDYKIHWDDVVKGYGLRVTPAGKKVFVAQGRVKGKAVILTIGTYGTYTEDKARARAQRLLQDMREGIDPRDVQKAEAIAAITLRQVADTYFARPGKLKDGTRIDMERYVEKALAAWKDKPLLSITEDMVRKRHRELATKGLHGKKPAPGTANLAMVTLRTLINFAMRQYRLADGSPVIPRNPVDVLRDHWAPLGSRTKRYIEKNKVGDVWNRLAETRATTPNPDAWSGIDLIRFLLLTGARRMEGAALTWDRVNIDDDDPTQCWFHLPDPKNGHEVYLPLSSQAVNLLKMRPRVEGNPHVFTSWSKAGHIMDARGPLETISEVSGLKLSCHDLRRTFTNIAMRECRIEKFRTDMLTNHKPKTEDVTANNYLDLTRLDWLHPEAQQVGDWIEKAAMLAHAKTTGASVAPMRAQRKSGIPVNGWQTSLSGQKREVKI